VSTSYRPGYEVAAERILELIDRHGWVPGDRLPTEQALADELGISRGVTREAVKILAAMGRVTAQRGRGLFVGGTGVGFADAGVKGASFMPGDPEQVEQLLKFRQIQEVAAAREAAVSANPPDLRILRECIAQGQTALDGDDRAAWDDADNRFHVAMATASGNRFLCTAVLGARQLQSQVVVLGLRGGTGGNLADAQEEHKRIYDAISAGDPDGAALAVEVHLSRTIRGYRAAITAALTTQAAGSS
jgi:DNA-binding FadR family transcriptional regulator